MTAPTHDGSISVRAQVMGIRSMATFHRTNKVDIPLADVLDSHADIISTLGESLAAVTAERDQARQQLSALGLMARSFADVVEERDHVRQMLTHAPHDNDCASGTMANVDEFYPCSCWKAGL